MLTILVSSDAGEVVNDAAAAIDIPAISSGTAPTAANASGAITIADPPPTPDMYVAAATKITMKAETYSALPFVSRLTHSSAAVYEPALNTAIATAELMIGTVIVSMVGIVLRISALASANEI